MNISGNISGFGSPSYYMNMSRRQAFNPQLIVDEQPYLLGDCPIAAIEYDGFSPNKIINLQSNENELYENSLDFYKVETIEFNSGLGAYITNYYQFAPNANDKLKYLITDYNSDTKNSNPLFYQYELLYDAFVDISGIIIKNIYKNNEIQINKDDYKVQYSTDLISDGNIRYSGTIWNSIRGTSNAYRTRILLPFYFSSKESFYTIEYDKYVYGNKLYQKELIEAVPLYSISNDYSITSSGVILSSSGNIKQSSTLSLLKDPFYRITPLDIVTLKDQNSYMSDKMAQWKLRLNIGSFFVPSGYYTGSSGLLYNLENNYTSSNIPITNIKPINIYDNIVQIKETPIYIDETKYVFPYYQVDTYDNTTTDLYDTPGKFSITINGVNRTDIKIKSIDRNKGFIEFDKSFNSLDDVEFSFYLKSGDFIILESFELNPKISSSARYNINKYPNGFGIALKNTSGELNYPFIYDLSSDPLSRIVSGIVEVGSSLVISDLWNDSYYTVCYGTLNNLSPDIIKKTDARRVGGGLVDNKSLDNWFSTLSGVYLNEKKWYTDVGNYDGLPLSNSSLIILNIPIEYINSLKEKWFNYFKSFNDYDTAETISEREFKHYLDQSIRKYISAGSDYILMPTISGQITGSILDLRNT